MSAALLILGNQLFPTKYYKKTKIKKVIMAEDYGLCTHYKYHKHKILLFLSAMRQFKEELSVFSEVSYYDSSHKLFKKPFTKKLEDFLKKNPDIDTIVSYEIEDIFFEKEIIDFAKKHKIEIKFLQTPMFLTDRDDLKVVIGSKKRPFMKTFYEWQRKRLEIMLNQDGSPAGGQWSFDQDNRKKLPKSVNPPSPLSVEHASVVGEVAKFVDKEFSDHPGTTENFWIPTTRKQSLKWLTRFIEYRLFHFGNYQDAITQRSDFVFHSVISPMMNMGLLLPEEVIEKVLKAQSDAEAPINSVEGFIRQVIGWREFVRGVYQNFGDRQWESNFWEHHRTLKPCWYSGETGIPVLDDSIKKANALAYNHHIERLMVISNMMLLCEIHPHQVYAWFMEMSADSSDWVMGPNVFGMGQFSDGGIFATKPYICGSNYYLKMGDYKKGEWCQTVDGLYWRFIEKHKAFYQKNPRMAVMTKSLEKMDPTRKKTIFAAAEKFIKKTTR